MDNFTTSNHLTGFEIAIIGMAGRFPGATNIDGFWQNLRNGVESISFFSDEELASSGIAPATRRAPNYVRAGGVLKDPELFDASFFGFTPREAEIIDPQHRIFLECAWEALEDAGYGAERYRRSTGIYASVSMNTYLLNNLHSSREPLVSANELQMMVGNDKDFLTTRVSYKLNLEGPSVVVQTACSSSLVAVHLAYQGLLSGDCDMALAGGASIHLPQKIGYLYQEEGIASPDGHCRAFDARAQGTVGGNGVGIVVLKRLADAVADGDCIHAVIKGSAINNDGAAKVGYTAPNVDAQAGVIARALAMAEVHPETIGVIEGHGTGTPLGDPIEIAALTQAFRIDTNEKEFCAIGSVKTNIGHLDAAAGVAGLLKTVLMLKHKVIAPSIHFEQPNPKIDFANSPFYVNTVPAEWQAGKTPRRAGVSSFGMGGTNAHVVLEEAPARKDSVESRPWQLLVLSAKTDTALETVTTNLVTRLKRSPDLPLADIAYTLQVGRKALNYRRMLVCRDVDDAMTTLETADAKRVFTTFQDAVDGPIVFMFPGQGSQYVNMAFELYQTEPAFRKHVDYCSELLKRHLQIDLRDVIYPSAKGAEAATQQLSQTFITQPALFVIEYALAQLWMSWGVRPQAMIGHSIGEYVAACLAGVFSLEDALALVAARGQLMQDLPGGAMLAVPLSVPAVESLLGEHLSLAAINSPSLCVVSGPTAAVAEFEAQLTGKGVDCRRLHTSHAFHADMMDAMLEPLTKQVGKITLNPPQTPYLSNVTGTWITATDATDVGYWAKHLRYTVRFEEGMQKLLKEPNHILLEVGPGRTLSTLASRHPDRRSEQVIVSSIRHPHDRQSDVAFLLNSLGKLWLSGIQVDWPAFYANERRHRRPLPTYPFEHERYWIEPQRETRSLGERQAALGKKPDIADWFYAPSWKRTVHLAPFEPENLRGQKLCWLGFADTCGLGTQMVKRLEQMGQDVSVVKAGTQFTHLGDHVYTINPQSCDDYDALIKSLHERNSAPNMIMHLWGVTPDEGMPSGTVHLKQALYLSFYSLLFLSRAQGNQNITHSLQIAVVTSNIQEVTGEEVLSPEKATVLGPCKVIPQEYSNITCRNIDIVVPESGKWMREQMDQLIAELPSSKPSELIVAYRGNHRWVQTFEAVQLNSKGEHPSRLREGGVYLITGGLGHIGSVLAEYLAQTVRAKLILVGRSDFPEREGWERWLATHDDEDSVSRKIRNVQRLEELGSEVMVVSADVASQEQMQAVVTRADERFGGIHGVIHAAGATREKSARAIQETGQTECGWQFRPKVYGLYVLEKVLQDKPLDFCLLFSSLSSILGGLGFVAYSAANLFMDAFAYQQNQAKTVPWISVNWDGWQFNEENEALESTVAEFALTPTEGVEAFQRILSRAAASQVVVSTGDLQSRLAQWVQLESLRDTTVSKQVNASSPDHARPNLQNAYVAPSNELEQTIADIWRKLLGIEQVGLHDNFLELGGHSLLATQLLYQLREEFQVGLTLQSFFGEPTIGGLSEIILDKLVEKEESETLTQILEEIEQLSEDDVQTVRIAGK